MLIMSTIPKIRQLKFQEISDNCLRVFRQVLQNCHTVKKYSVSNKFHCANIVIKTIPLHPLYISCCEFTRCYASFWDVPLTFMGFRSRVTDRPINPSNISVSNNSATVAVLRCCLTWIFNTSEQ